MTERLQTTVSVNSTSYKETCQIESYMYKGSLFFIRLLLKHFVSWGTCTVESGETIIYILTHHDSFVFCLSYWICRVFASFSHIYKETFRMPTFLNLWWLTVLCMEKMDPIR